MPLEQVESVLHKAAPRRANVRGHGTEGKTSMRDQRTGLCECGCGQQTARHKSNDTKRGYVKGEPKRFIRGHNANRPGELYRVDPESGCWVWLRGTNGVGYGTLRRNGRDHYAHRWFYEKHVGPIPAGLELDHLCRNRLCCNPEHLEAVTRTENLRRGFGPAAINARKTHCVNGHPLSGTNLYVDPKGRRQCRTCREAAMERLRNSPTHQPTHEEVRP
jgi:hypothetical protein